MDSITKQLMNDVNVSIIQLRGAYAQWCRERQINYYELLIFYSLLYGGRCTQKQICENYRIPKQSVNNLIQSLRRDGYLELIPEEGDRREKLLAFTEKGEAYAASVMAPLQELEERAVEKMGREKLREMTGLVLQYGAILDELFFAENTSDPI